MLDDGRELESALVVVGVGARPNTQLLQGQVDVEDQKPGGIPVRCCRVQTLSNQVKHQQQKALIAVPVSLYEAPIHTEKLVYMVREPICTCVSS